ncbi:MAG: hypothetical protein FD180_3053 [Planctomycetota bacterium]|nr:MAG: hypothetical protein FD180_3053 [Planctomycetota bacterium]
MVEVARASGYREIDGLFAPRELAEYLRERPGVIDPWVKYSEDKRTSGGWYLRPPYSIGRMCPTSPPMHEVKHVDLAAACAAFIIAEVGEILLRASERS